MHAPTKPCRTMAETTKEKLDELADAITGCKRCPLWKGRTHAVPGDGPIRARVMLVGEAPGAEEDESGHPFVGAAGRYLNHVLEEHGLDRAAFFVTNVVKCRPPENRKPRKRELDTCTSNYLAHQIAWVDPAYVVLLGSTAATYVLDGVKSLKQVRGEVIEQEGRAYLATYHPASRFYRKDLGELLKEDLGRLKALLEEER